jgi:hypothetical protein
MFVIADWCPTALRAISRGSADIKATTDSNITRQAHIGRITIRIRIHAILYRWRLSQCSNQVSIKQNRVVHTTPGLARIVYILDTVSS